MLSMTGYGRGAAENEDYRIEVSLRAVNHRFLDLSLHLPEFARTSEPGLRDLLSGRLARGRVEVKAEIWAIGEEHGVAEVDRELAADLRRAADQLAADGIVEEGLTFGDLLRVPDLVRSRRHLTWRPEDETLLQEAMGAALEELIASRRSEGRRLAELLEARRGALSRLVAELRERRKEVEDALAEAFRARVQALAADEAVDETRLAQEVVLLVERSSVAEEIDRLEAHLERFETGMAEGSPCGKALDFLAQEISRELNTLAAKCRDSEMAGRVVDGKTLCEELREQLRNVE